MKTADFEGSAEFEVVDDVLDDLDLTATERSRIKAMAAGLLTLEASLKDLRVVQLRQRHPPG